MPIGEARTTPVRRRAAFVAAVVFGLVALADWLFYGHPLGINAGLFAAALLLAVLLRARPRAMTRASLLLVGLLLGLMASLLLEPGPLPILLALVGLFLLATTTRGGWTRAATVRGLDLLRAAGAAIVQSLRDARTARRWRRARGRALSAAAVALRVGAPLAFGLAFIGLFALANPIISRELARLPDLPAPLRMGLWVLIGALAWGLLRARIRAGAAGAARPDAFAFVERLGGTRWIACCLLGFNALFAVQTALDLRYLVGGADLPEGMTYAAYAHRGAYPLVVTALLAGLFVLGTVRPGGAAERSAWIRVLVGFFVAQNMLLVATAFWRLALYVDVYSLSRWRVAAAIWMLLVAVGLALLVIRIASSRGDRWLVRATGLSAAAILYACCFVDFGGFIAGFNVARCRELAAGSDGAVAPPRAPLDLVYLESLGPPALPALASFAARADSVRHAERIGEARLVEQRLRDELEATLEDWRGWTVRRAALASSR